MADFFDTLYSLNGLGSLEEMQRLASKLGNPHLNYPTIHVAGTNGKGSVTHKISKVLELSGYRVGTYTSPHLFSFNERIAVSSETIAEEEAEEGLKKLIALNHQLGIQPKFFELATLLAFEYFSKKEVDVAVIETGLGGRLDSTNIVLPIISVITSIGFDHEAILGPTLEDIAREKGGIIKEGVPLVLGPRANQAILTEIALKKKAPVYYASPGQGFEGDNQAISLKTIELLLSRFNLPVEAVSRGIASRPKCRFEVLTRISHQISGNSHTLSPHLVSQQDEAVLHEYCPRPAANQSAATGERFVQRSGEKCGLNTPGPVILDVAHNCSGFERLFEDVKREFPGHQINLLFSLSKDKDLASLIPLFLDNVQEIALFYSSHPRLSDPQQIAKTLEKGSFKSCTTHQNAEEALKYILEKEGVGLIAGSFFIMKEAVHFLRKLMPQLR